MVDSSDEDDEKHDEVGRLRRPDFEARTKRMADLSRPKFHRATLLDIEGKASSESDRHPHHATPPSPRFPSSDSLARLPHCSGAPTAPRSSLLLAAPIPALILAAAAFVVFGSCVSVG